MLNHRLLKGLYCGVRIFKALLACIDRTSAIIYILKGTSEKSKNQPMFSAKHTGRKGPAKSVTTDPSKCL